MTTRTHGEGGGSNNWPRERRLIVVGFAVASVIMLLVGAESYLETIRVADAAAARKRSFEVQVVLADTAARLVDELFGMANASQNPELTLQAHHAAWPSLMVGGDLAAARHHIDKGLALYRREAHGHQALQYGGHDPEAPRAVAAAVDALLGVGL